MRLTAAERAILSKAFVKIRSAGGHARADKLTAARRKEIAAMGGNRKAALAKAVKA